MTDLAEFKLTQYSHGAGCGCKIAPKVLDSILKNQNEKQFFPNLIVGNEERDDAAVLDIGGGVGIVSTTDFFMPIVDDPFQFGQIASVNAISDIYAMGATPILAIAVLGWPINQIPPEIANLVIEGARKACAEAKIPLAGGHSIDAPEPIFGLAVTGKIELQYLKKNGGATVGSKLFLTKPLGVGILTTAQKKGKLLPRHDAIALKSMTKLNDLGESLGCLAGVEAMTDVTGFGLLGHLSEMCEASGVSAEIEFNKVPTVAPDILDFYLSEKCIPGGTHRNWDSYGQKISDLAERQKFVLCDPQTSGGLLIAVNPDSEQEFLSLTKSKGYDLIPFGKMIAKSDKLIYVR